MKLEKALSVFGIQLEGMTCVDVGASTGGFTDVMLKTAPGRSIPWMWAMASLPGPFARTKGCLHGENQFPLYQTRGYR